MGYREFSSADGHGGAGTGLLEGQRLLHGGILDQVPQVPPKTGVTYRPMSVASEGSAASTAMRCAQPYPELGQYPASSYTPTVVGDGVAGGSELGPLPRGGTSWEGDMGLFMDVHHMDGSVSAADVAQAHQRDLETQGKYGVSYQRYWVDEEQGKIFCLVEAPDAEAAARVHREAHGLVADEIYKVEEGS